MMTKPIPTHLAKFAAKFNDAEAFAMPKTNAFPRVEIGSERFTAFDAEGNETLLGLKFFEFMTIAANPGDSRTWYAQAYDGDTISAPDCFTNNGFYPDRKAPRPQGESCTLCDQSRWGSAKSKLTGKDIPACQKLKKLAIVPLGGDIFKEDTDLGVHKFHISPAALTNWGRYVEELSKMDLGNGMVVTPSLVITKAKWSAKKNIMDFELVDFVTEDELTYIEGQKAENVFETWIGTDKASQTYPQLSSPGQREVPKALTHQRSETVDAEYETVTEPEPAPRRGRAAKAESVEADEPEVAANPRRSRGAPAAAATAKTPMEVAKERIRRQVAGS